MRMQSVIFIVLFLVLVGFKSSNPNAISPQSWTYAMPVLNWNSASDNDACSAVWTNCQNEMDSQHNNCVQGGFSNCQDNGAFEQNCQALVQACYSRVQSAQTQPNQPAQPPAVPLSNGFDVKSYSYQYNMPQLPWDWNNCYNSLEACRKSAEDQYNTCKLPIETEGRRVCYASLCWNFWSNWIDEKCGVANKRIDEQCSAEYTKCEQRSTNERNQRDSQEARQRQQKCTASGGEWVANTQICRCGEQYRLNAEGTACVIMPVEDSCFDSDGGSTQVKGTVTFKSAKETKTYTDDCQDENTLSENDCESKRVTRKTIPCACNCKEGACQACNKEVIRDIVELINPDTTTCTTDADCAQSFTDYITPRRCAGDEVQIEREVWTCNEQFRCVSEGTKFVRLKSCLQGCLAGQCVINNPGSMTCKDNQDCPVKPAGKECSNNDFWTDGKGSAIRQTYNTFVCENRVCVTNPGERYTKIIETCPEGTVCAGTEPVCKDKKAAMLEEVERKCNDIKNQNPVVSSKEFITYLENLEKNNPDASRNQLVAKLHQKAYEVDVNARYFGIKLFQRGTDTDGFEKVTLFCRNEPKFVQLPDGKTVDIAHAYAGVRSDLNRGSVSRRFMRNVNTHWGDTFQTWIHWDNRYAPPDQRTGNDAGIWLAKYYLEDANKNKPLSEGFADYFRRTGPAIPQ